VTNLKNIRAGEIQFFRKSLVIVTTSKPSLLLHCLFVIKRLQDLVISSSKSFVCAVNIFWWTYKWIETWFST